MPFDNIKEFNELQEFINDIYALKYIIRYNNLPKISEESVAEHSFFVASLVLKLHEDYEFNLEKALKMAITHDYVEIYISDVPRNVKNRYPVLNEALEAVESQAWKDLFPQFSSLNKEFEAKQTNESLIVKLADSLSIIQYTYSEVKLGNEGYMKSVFDGTTTQVIQLLNGIEKLKRKKE